MENIFNYGPKKIRLHEISRKTGEVVLRAHNVMPLSESSLNQMMEHGKTGMIIISASRSEIDSDNPDLSLRSSFEHSVNHKFPGGLQSLDAEELYDVQREWLRKRNAISDATLKNEIKAAGYSYTPVYGGYHGNELGPTTDTYEPSYVVYSYDREGQLRDFEQLKEFGILMCRKFKQESVYVQAPGEPPVYLDGNGDQISSNSSDSFKFNRDQEQFYTTTKRDKSSPQRFTADIRFNEMYIPLRPADYNERLRRLTEGEFIL